MPHSIKTSNLSVTLNGIQLVQPTTLSVNSGEAVGIIGLNGAGKSTLMKAIIGLIPHQGFSNISSQSFEDRAIDMPHSIKTSNLSVTLNGVQLVQPTTLSVNSGEAVGIIGLNGAGKSTLMKAIIGLIPHQGFSNISSQSFEDRARLSAWVPQTREIVWDVSVETLLGFTLRNFRYQNESNVNLSDKMNFSIKDALLATNTSKLSNRNIGSLSGGELTSVLIARALVQQTSTIFLDEPLASLDPVQKISVLSLIQELSKTGITIIASLHDVEIAQSYFTRFLGIKAGKVVADGSPKRLLSKKHFKEIFLC